MRYLVIFFESNLKSPFVSAEFEPYELADRKIYYTQWEEAGGLLNKVKVKTKKNNKPKAKTFKFK